MNQYGYQLIGVITIIFLLGCFFKSNMYQSLLNVDTEFPSHTPTPPHQVLPTSASQDIVSYNDPRSNPSKPFSVCHMPRAPCPSPII